MGEVQLIDRVLADPGSFLKAFFKPNFNSASQYSLKALEDYVTSLGYSRSDIISLVEDVFGFSITTSLVDTDAGDAGKAPSKPLPADFRIVTKPIFGTYRITKYAGLSSDAVAKLPKLTVLPHKSNLRVRKVIYGSATASPTVQLHQDDGLWHVQTSTTSDLLLNLTFHLESRVDGSVSSTFSGDLAVKSPDSRDVETASVEGELDRGLRSLAAIIGAEGATASSSNLPQNARVLSESSRDPPPSQAGGAGSNGDNNDYSGWYIGGFLFVAFMLCCLCMCFPAVRDGIYNRLIARFNARVPPPNGPDARRRQIELANESGSQLNQGDNVRRNTLDASRTDLEAPPEGELISPEEAYIEPAAIDRLKKSEKTDVQLTCSVIKAKSEEDDRGDGKGDKNNEQYLTPRFGGSGNTGANDAGKHQDNTTVTNTQGITTMSAGLCRSMSELIDDIELAYVEPLRVKAIEELQSSFTQYDEFNRIAGPPRQQIIDWPSVAEAALHATQADLVAMKQPVSMEKVQTIYLAKLGPVVMNALQGHLTPLYVKQTTTTAGKVALACFGTPEFPTAVLKVAVTEAMCSPEIGELLASEIRRSSYTKFVQSQNLLHLDDPQKAAIETFNAQQEVEAAAAEARDRAEQFLDSVEKLRAQGEAATATSIDKLAAEFKMQRIDANSFAVLYQFKNYPTGEWALMLSRFGKQNLGKPTSAGGKIIGGKLTMQEVRARQIEVYAQSSTSSRAQVRVG